PAVLSLRVCGLSASGVASCRGINSQRKGPSVCSIDEGLCRGSGPPRLMPVPTSLRVSIDASSPHLVVRGLGAAEEPLYGADQQSLWHWSVASDRPGSYLVVLAVALVDAEAGVRVTIQKMVVRIVVTKGAGDYVADAFVEIKRGFNWVVGVVGLLGVGTLLVERLLGGQAVRVPRGYCERVRNGGRG